MLDQDRRRGFRVPTEIFMNQYVHDHEFRSVTTNISETGVYMSKTLTPISRPSRIVSLEFELPGTLEPIWARAEIRYDSLDDLMHGQGVRFTGMAERHQRLLRDYCVETRRARLANLLDRIRRSRLS